MISSIDAAILLAKMSERVGASGFYQPSPVSSPAKLNSTKTELEVPVKENGNSAALMQDEQRSPSEPLSVNYTETHDIHSGGEVSYFNLGLTVNNFLGGLWYTSI